MTVGHCPPLDDGVVQLREVTLADAPELYRWRSDPRSRDCFRTTTLGGYEQHLAFVQRHLAGGNRDQWFVIEVAGKPVGAIALYDFSTDARSAEWGRLVIDPGARSRGYARRALKLLIGHAHVSGLAELRCEVLAANAGAAGLYRALGFVETGAEMVGGRRFLHLQLVLDP